MEDLKVSILKERKLQMSKNIIFPTFKNHLKIEVVV